jgi:hypothetical protein
MKSGRSVCSTIRIFNISKQVCCGKLGMMEKIDIDGKETETSRTKKFGELQDIFRYEYNYYKLIQYFSFFMSSLP